jgi:hypothetical protein
MDNIGCQTYLLSIQMNLRYLRTQKDLPPVCEHLIQSNPVSFAQERSALDYTQVFTANTSSSSAFPKHRTSKTFYLDAQKNLIT